MTFCRSAVHRKIHSIPQLRFEEQQLTSFSGLILFQLLFIRLQFIERLRGCFRHLTVGPIFGHAKIVLLLVVHMLLAYRELRDIRYYCDDPLVKRIMGLQRLPDVATVSRSLASADKDSVLHRCGNVHDSNGAEAFILQCIEHVREVLPGIAIEVRMDGVFFSDPIVRMLDRENVQYTISVPFERLVELEQRIESRHLWYWLNHECAYFQVHWKSKSWKCRHWFRFIRTAVKKQRKDPVQLDLFVPHETGFEFKVILTNKRLSPKKVLAYHNGRGSQEGIFAELKSANQSAYVPTRTWVGNQIYLLSAVLAHNLAREIQMAARSPARNTSQKRPALWEFARMNTLRCRLIQRAGRLIRPQSYSPLSPMLSNIGLSCCLYVPLRPLWLIGVKTGRAERKVLTSSLLTVDLDLSMLKWWATVERLNAFIERLYARGCRYLGGSSPQRETPRLSGRRFSICRPSV